MGETRESGRDRGFPRHAYAFPTFKPSTPLTEMPTAFLGASLSSKVMWQNERDGAMVKVTGLCQGVCDVNGNVDSPDFPCRYQSLRTFASPHVPTIPGT